MVMGAVEKMVRGTAWNDLDILVVDLPPGTGDIHLSLMQSVECSGGLVVTTPQRVALKDARRGLDMFRKMGVPILGLIENMSAFVCGACGEVTPIFGSGQAFFSNIHCILMYFYY